MPLDLEIIFEFGSVTPLEAWNRLRASHPDLLADTVRCSSDDKSITVSEFAKKIARGEPHFRVELGEATFDYSPIRNFDHLLVRVEGAIANLADAAGWCGTFLDHGSFRSARVYDRDYDHWQNAEDPLEYTSAGRPYKHLPLKSNGLPPPLEQMVIDISKNPGRRILRQGYVEAVGSRMWLGAGFWALTGASREQVRDQSWLKSDLHDGVLQIQANDMPFATAEGKSGELQSTLRALLFPLAIKSKVVPH